MLVLLERIKKPANRRLELSDIHLDARSLREPFEIAAYVSVHFTLTLVHFVVDSFFEKFQIGIANPYLHDAELFETRNHVGQNRAIALQQKPMRFVWQRDGSRKRHPGFDFVDRNSKHRFWIPTPTPTDKIGCGRNTYFPTLHKVSTRNVLPGLSNLRGQTEPNDTDHPPGVVTPGGTAVARANPSLEQSRSRAECKSPLQGRHGDFYVRKACVRLALAAVTVVLIRRPPNRLVYICS